jgi:hypothetical protein
MRKRIFGSKESSYKTLVLQFRTDRWRTKILEVIQKSGMKSLRTSLSVVNIHIYKGLLFVHWPCILQPRLAKKYVPQASQTYLNATERCDAHVKENTVQYWHGDELQQEVRNRYTRGSQAPI